MDCAATVRRNAHQIIDRQRWLAEKIRAALVFEYQQLPLNGADRACRYIAIAAADLFRVLRQIAEQFPQILEIDEAFSVGRLDFRIVVREPEGDIDDAL